MPVEKKSEPTPAPAGNGAVQSLALVPGGPNIAALETPTEPTRIDKSALAIGNTRRYRDKAHLRFVAKEPCLICGRKPCDPHHLRFAQNRALGRKVSDEFTVPLCRTHHRALHRAGNEALWWQTAGHDPVKAASKLWEETRVRGDAATKRARRRGEEIALRPDSSAGGLAPPVSGATTSQPPPAVSPR
jgi:hypothetical protein